MRANSTRARTLVRRPRALPGDLCWETASVSSPWNTSIGRRAAQADTWSGVVYPRWGENARWQRRSSPATARARNAYPEVVRCRDWMRYFMWGHWDVSGRGLALSSDEGIFYIQRGVPNCHPPSTRLVPLSRPRYGRLPSHAADVLQSTGYISSFNHLETMTKI